MPRTRETKTHQNRGHLPPQGAIMNRICPLHTPILQFHERSNSHCEAIKAMARRLSTLQLRKKNPSSQTRWCTNWLVCRIGLLSTILGSWGNGWVTLKRSGGPSNVLEGGHKL